MSPEEAKLELQQQAMRLGYIVEKDRGLQRLLNTIDAVIDGTGTYSWSGGNDSIVHYIRKLQRRPAGRRR
jgi:hypothetical protein